MRQNLICDQSLRRIGPNFSNFANRMIPSALESMVTADEPLADRLWLGIGGPTRYLALPRSDDDVVDVARWAADESLPLRMLGGGSNLLVRESGVDGVVVRLPSAELPLTTESNRLTFAGGTKLSAAVVASVGAGMAGLEHLVGLPGTVGGGAVGNVSAGGRDIGTAVIEVSVLAEDLTIQKIPHEQLRFSHRSSALGDRPILSVTFQLEPTDVMTLTKRMQKLWIGRGHSKPDRSQRVAMPFIDPDGMSTGDLLRSVGLAGLREGGAAMDDSRPELLTAQPGATSDECLRLIERVREQVRMQTGVDLQLNLQIW